MRIGLRSRAAALEASERACATTMAAWLTRECVVIREMVGNVIAVATPMMTRTITSSSRVKPAARGGGQSMPSPFGRPWQAHCLATPRSLQAGAPSDVAMLSGSAASLTKIAHVTFAAPVRLLFVIDASQPPPAALIETRLLPVVGHQLTSPAAGVHATPPTLLVTLVLYLTESAKYASSAARLICRSLVIEDRDVFSFVLANFGIAIAAKMPMITTTISSSIRVKPLRFMWTTSREGLECGIAELFGSRL